MGGWVASLFQVQGDQECPVAVCGVLFGAHDGGGLFFGQCCQEGDGLVELVGLAHQHVVRPALAVVVLGVLGSAAQGASERRVVDSLLAECFLQGRLVELGSVAAVGE